MCYSVTQTPLISAVVVLTITQGNGILSSHTGIFLLSAHLERRSPSLAVTWRTALGADAALDIPAMERVNAPQAGALP